MFSCLIIYHRLLSYLNCRSRSLSVARVFWSLLQIYGLSFSPSAHFASSQTQQVPCKKQKRQKNSGLMRRSVNHMFTEKPLVTGAFQRDARFALSEAKQTDCLGNMCPINFVHEGSWTATAAAAPAEEEAQSPPDTHESSPLARPCPRSTTHGTG